MVKIVEVRFDKGIPSIDKIVNQFQVNTGLDLDLSLNEKGLGTASCKIFKCQAMVILSKTDNIISVRLGYDRKTYFLSALFFSLVDLGGEIIAGGWEFTEISRKKFADVLEMPSLSRHYLDLK
ncbi:hypothetical protein [Microscilla marina]|uniref:Uncharacterized protein n=1 Tax=Microscilla marina ATCC 23134 TaxID=313606 RepID=A2A030_MICM2|nr:hypothetical protein [Microscilla marina]EAY24005.1 hypothetical protein M23134_01305 [Microscilla marina ATCC 23134]